MNQNPSFIMQSLVDDKMRNEKHIYKVRWKGFSEQYDTWELEDSIDKQLLQDYNKKKKKITESKSKDLTFDESLEKLKKKKPQQVFAVYHIKDKIYYRVLFEDQTFDSISSDLLRILDPNLITSFLISHFQVQLSSQNAQKAQNQS